MEQKDKLDKAHAYRKYSELNINKKCCFDGEMSPARWWNMSFLLSFPHRALTLTTTHRQVYLCGGLGAQQRSSSTLMGQKKKKNQRTDTLKRVRRTDSLYPHHPSFHSSTAQCQETQPQAVISPMAESERVASENSASQTCGMLAKYPLLSFLTTSNEASHE